MKRINIDKGWEYTYWKDWWRKQEPIPVDLPHDWSIAQKRSTEYLSGSGGAYYPGEVLMYTKKLNIPKDMQGDQIIIEFEGAYSTCEVKINNQFAAINYYGYSTFHADLTRHINFGGKNELKVTVSNTALPNTRWYSGTGLYRHVWLLTGKECTIAPWGVYITTPKVSKDSSTVHIETQLSCTASLKKDYTLRSKICDADGKIIASDTIKPDTNAGGKTTAIQDIPLNDVTLWSAENPYLYTLKSMLLSDDEVIDEVITPFGIREIKADSENGLTVNGEKVALKGGCIHHDNGLLGAASYDRAEERKAELLKNSGYNAVRCAHNPPAPAFLDACDRIGLYVIDETFDCWREGKNPHDYHLYFEDNWKKDTAAMVLRDRNHPSVIMWSTGNEIPERGGMSDGYELSKKLAQYVRSLDNTRLITNALNNINANANITNIEANLLVDDPDYDIFGECTKDFVAPLDVVGYNYLNSRYEKDKFKFPERVICGTESFPKEAYVNWCDVEKNSNVIGDFVWTAIDYLGETAIGHVWRNGETLFFGEYPWRLAYCGDIDILGFKRPQSYYRDALWSHSQKPYIAVEHPKYFGKDSDISPWGWPDVSPVWDYSGYEDKKTHIEVYCALDEVELILNGKSFGKKPCGKANKYTANFEIDYEPGVLTAVGYENGCAKTYHELKTPGKFTKIRMIPDRSEINAANDLSYITIEACDNEGNLVSTANDMVTVSVKGEGKLLALASSDPKSTHIYTENTCEFYEGRMMCVVKSMDKVGEISVGAICENKEVSDVIIHVK